MRWHLVGRESELDAAVDAVGTGRSVAFVGPTGVGKSRLLAELAARVETPRHPVFRIVATDATRTVPLSSFIRLLPESPPRDPSLLLRAVLDQLVRRRGTDGLLVAIDDAHLLDDSSTALLGLIDDDLGVTVAVSVSSDRATPDGLSAVLDRDTAERVHIAPLERPELMQLVDQSLGQHDDLDGDERSDLGEHIWRVTQGNPLVARELLSDLAELGSDVVGTTGKASASASEDPTGRHPTRVDPPVDGPRLRDLVRRRLAKLPDDLNDALDLVAVGAPVPYELLEAAVPDQLVRLEEHELVEVAVIGDDTVVRPAHPLLGEVFAVHAGETRRRRAYRRLGAAATGHPTAVDPLRVALWQVAANSELDPVVAAAGAVAAVSRHDGVTAAALLAPVLDQLDGAGHLLHATALCLQGRNEEAEAVLDSSVGSADPVEIASLRSFNLAFGLGRIDDAIEVLADAAAALDTGAARSRLDAERGVIAGIRGDFNLAAAASAATLDSAEAQGATRASAYVTFTLAEAMLGHCDTVSAVLDAALDAAATCPVEMPFARDQIMIMAAQAQLAAGRVDEAVELARSELDRENSSPLTRTPWLSTSCIFAMFTGRLDEAVAAADISLQHVERADPFRLAGQTMGIDATIRAMRAAPVERAGLDELRTRHPEPRAAVWIDRGRAWTAAAAGHLDNAARIAAAGGIAAIEGQHVLWGAAALHDAVRFGRPDLVVEPLRAAAADTSGAHLVSTMARHAEALGNRSTEALTDVGGAFRRQGALLVAAEVAAQTATLFAEDGDATSSARATAVARALLESCTGARTPALLALPPGLSEREMEIAIDAARGHTSAQIAEQRFISVRTVDNHLGQVYRTLDVGGRDHLTALLEPVLTRR